MDVDPLYDIRHVSKGFAPGEGWSGRVTTGHGVIFRLDVDDIN